MPPTLRLTVTLQPGGGEQRRQLTEVTAHEVGGEQRHRLWPGDAGAELDERFERGLRFEGARDDHRDCAVLSGDSRHLAESGRAVGEEHQRHLAQHRVERPVGERERGHVTLSPSDVGASVGGNSEHRLVEIDPDDRAARPTRSAAVRATIPVPQATSSTVRPGATLATSQRIGAHWAKKAGTKADSYSSAASMGIWNVSAGRSEVVIRRACDRRWSGASVN